MRRRRLGSGSRKPAPSTSTHTDRIEHPSRAGELVVTAGGPAEVFARSAAAVPAVREAVVPRRPVGERARTKLVVNLVLGLNRAVLAEGLAFARRCGLNLDTVLEVLRAVRRTRGRWTRRAEDDRRRQFAPEARLVQHLKDVRLILDVGASNQAVVPFSTLHARLLADLVARGFGESDNSGVIRAFEREGGEP